MIAFRIPRTVRHHHEFVAAVSVPFTLIAFCPAEFLAHKFVGRGIRTFFHLRICFEDSKAGVTSPADTRCTRSSLSMECLCNRVRHLSRTYRLLPPSHAFSWSNIFPASQFIFVRKEKNQSAWVGRSFLAGFAYRNAPPPGMDASKSDTSDRRWRAAHSWSIVYFVFRSDSL